MFSSVFAHEVSLDNCRDEIDETVVQKDLQEAPKAAVLGETLGAFT